MKGYVKKILIGALTIILIIIMFMYVDINNIILNLKKISVLGIFLFSLIYMGVFFLRALRLKLIFKPLNLNPTYLSLIGAFGIGWAVNELTPGKIGDLLRIEIITQKNQKLSLSKSTCAVAIERFIDLLILFSISFSSLLFMYLSNIQGTSEINLHFPLILGASIISLGMITIAILFLKTEWFLKTIAHFSIKLKLFIEKFLKNFLEGIDDFRKDKKNAFLVIFLSLPIWIFEALTLILLFYLAGYEINPLIIVISQIILFFTKTFPITPGGWILSENVGTIIIFIFYPSILYSNLLSIFILDHVIRTAFVFIYGLISSLFLNIKYDKLSLKIVGNNVDYTGNS